MNISILQRKNRIHLYDWLLVLGIVLAPMTGLRVWKAGPAEVLCLLWAIRHYPSRIIDIKNDVFQFFVGFLGCMFIGTIWGMIVAPRELRPMHWTTWLYLAYIALAIYEGLKKNSQQYNERILYRICCLSSIWYLFLYQYSIHVSKRFFGAPLWYGNVRFTGGATNPHQVAVLMCGVTFCLLRSALKKELPILSTLFAAIAIYVELQTDSATGTAALVMGAAFLIYVATIHNSLSVNNKLEITFFEILVFIAVLALMFDNIYGYIHNWIVSDSNGQGRINLFNQIGTTIAKSPFFGLGPGLHALTYRGHLIEYHNSYTEIIAATGLVGFAVFIRFTISAIKNIFYEDLFFPALVSIYVYGMGGFAMRRLAFWGIFMLIYVISEQKKNKFYEEQEMRMLNQESQ